MILVEQRKLARTLLEIDGINAMIKVLNNLSYTYKWRKVALDRQP